jgi:hypothetical protein
VKVDQFASSLWIRSASGNKRLYFWNGLVIEECLEQGHVCMSEVLVQNSFRQQVHRPHHHQLLRTPPLHPWSKSSSSMTLQDNHLLSCIYRPEDLCLSDNADDSNSRLEKGSRRLIGGNFEFLQPFMALSYVYM